MSEENVFILFTRYVLSSSEVVTNYVLLAQVIKVPKMGDSISEGTVQSFVKSKYLRSKYLKKMPRKSY
jgi:hypothetical protein